MGLLFSSFDHRSSRAEAASRAADATVPKAVNVADLEVGRLDSTGETVLAFYGRKPPDFAVYQTENRVLVHFADEKAAADEQRKALAILNPVRGEINGLIDGWRLREQDDPRYRRAVRFDRRVGDALVVAFEEDVPDAALILARIKQDVVEERTAWARFEYLIAAFLVGLVGIALALLVGWSEPHQGGWLWSAAAAGAVGAFFSIAIGIRSRTILTDLLWLANTMDAVLRMIIGMIGASLLFALLDLKLVKLAFGSVDLAPTHDCQGNCQTWLIVLVIGFVAGFSERLVPDILSTAVAKPADPLPRRDADRQPAAGRKKEAAAQTSNAASSGDDVDPAPEQAAIDHCACDIDMSDAEATRDEDLPAASGGVAAPAAPKS